MNQDYYQHTKEWFKNWARFYDVFTAPISRIREKVVDMAKAEKWSRVLDVCTGTGAQAFAFGKRGHDVVGVDLSPDMLKVAERKNKYKNVRFEVADATKLPFDDNSFDVSCISFALHDMPHEIRHEVLDEMRRVSRRVVVVDYHIPQNGLQRRLHVFFTSLYEGKYYKDFAKRDLKELLQQHDLRVAKEAYWLVDFVKILVCEVATGANSTR